LDEAADDLGFGLGLGGAAFDVGAGGEVPAEPTGVVSGGDEGLAGDVGPDAVERDQVRGALGDERGEDGLEVVDLDGELLVAGGRSNAAPPWWPRCGTDGGRLQVGVSHERETR
jgi:hypothetical protein